MRRALLFALTGLGLTACGPGSPFCSKAHLNLALPGPAVALTDEAVNVEVRLTTITRCPSGTAAAESVALTVTDGSGQPVEVTTSDLSSSETDGHAARAGFVPHTPGRYRVTAKFEPTLGTAEREVVVLRHRAGVTAQALPGLEACTEVDVTSTGALVCLTGAGRLQLLRGAAKASDEAATGVVVAGADVWSWTAAAVTRWSDGGSGALSKVGEVFVGSDFSNGGGAVTAQGLVLVNRTRIVRVVDNGGLSVNLDTPLSANLPAAATDRLRVGLGEAGALTLAQGGSVCHLPDVTAGDASCYAIGGQVQAEEAGGFWFTAAPEAPRYVHLAGAPPTPHTFPVGELPEALTPAQAPGVPVWLLDGKPVAPLTTQDAFDAFTASPKVDAVVRAAPRVVVVQVAGATQWLPR